MSYVAEGNAGGRLAEFEGIAAGAGAGRYLYADFGVSAERNTNGNGSVDADGLSCASCAAAAVDGDEQAVGGGKMAVEERLHEVLGGYGGVRDAVAVDLGVPLEGEIKRLVVGGAGGGEGEADVVASGGDARAGEFEAGRCVAQIEVDGTAEAVFAEGVDADRGGEPGAEVDTGGRDAEFEVGRGRCDAEAIGVGLAAVHLCIDDLGVIGTVGGEGRAEIAVGMVGYGSHLGVQVALFVLIVVVPGKHGAGFVEEADDRVEGRAHASGDGFENDLLPPAAGELEQIDITGLIDAAVDDARQRDGLRVFEGVVGLDFDERDESVNLVRDDVGGVGAAAEGGLPDAGGARLAVDAEAVGVQVPAGDGDVAFLSGAAAEREDGGDEGSLADTDAIDEILSAAIDGVANFEGVGAVGGDLVVEDGIGAEAIVIDECELVAALVVEGDGGLEPAWNGVGEIGDELAGAGLDDELLALGGEKAELVDVAGENLAVNEDGGFECGFGREELDDPGVAELGFLVLGEDADLETEGVGEAEAGVQAEFAVSRLGVAVDANFDEDGSSELAIALAGEFAAEVVYGMKNFSQALVFEVTEVGVFGEGDGLGLGFAGLFGVGATDADAHRSEGGPGRVALNRAILDEFVPALNDEGTDTAGEGFTLFPLEVAQGGKLLDDPGVDAVAGDVCFGRAAEELSADDDLDGRAAFCAGGEDVADLGIGECVLGDGLCRQRRGDEDENNLAGAHPGFAWRTRGGRELREGGESCSWRGHERMISRSVPALAVVLPGSGSTRTSRPR